MSTNSTTWLQALELLLSNKHFTQLVYDEQFLQIVRSDIEAGHTDFQISREYAVGFKTEQNITLEKNLNLMIHMMKNLIPQLSEAAAPTASTAAAAAPPSSSQQSQQYEEYALMAKTSGNAPAFEENASTTTAVTDTAVSTSFLPVITSAVSHQRSSSSSKEGGRSEAVSRVQSTVSLPPVTTVAPSTGTAKGAKAPAPDSALPVRTIELTLSFKPIFGFSSGEKGIKQIREALRAMLTTAPGRHNGRISQPQPLRGEGQSLAFGATVVARVEGAENVRPFMKHIYEQVNARLGQEDVLGTICSVSKAMDQVEVESLFLLRAKQYVEE